MQIQENGFQFHSNNEEKDLHLLNLGETMDKNNADDLFSDYFETLDSGDILPNPVCEINDALEGFGDDLNLDPLESNPLIPDDLLTPITSIVEQDFGPDNPGEGTSSSFSASSTNVETIIKQELNKTDNEPEASQTPLPPPTGLKIASFAVDPDVCSIVDQEKQPEQPEQVERVTKNST